MLPSPLMILLNIKEISPGKFVDKWKLFKLIMERKTVWFDVDPKFIKKPQDVEGLFKAVYLA